MTEDSVETCFQKRSVVSPNFNVSGTIQTFWQKKNKSDSEMLEFPVNKAEQRDYSLHRRQKFTLNNLR